MTARAPAGQDRPTPIPTALSDLFFNHDLSDAYHDGADPEDDGATRFDADKLAAEARIFLDCLEALGVGGLPTTSELIEDFYGRI